MNADEIVFGELPPRAPSGRRGEGPLAAVVRQLQQRPGEWACLGARKSPADARGAAVYMRRRYVGVQATARGSELWARWSPTTTEEIP